ncbi:hypothetical protein A9Q84_08565 [Halobacteriovorax marinus]|uniref:Auto-transporter adhesin head GIN domain-containing protein n=1 Tax=Halobacteriovorax marinus TaxID=97084 RepID=A0A1Y5F6H4_9BACT|nr:hypothetical protein A9Q84_08565 [Halobacteriovorax marinus]
MKKIILVFLFLNLSVFAQYSFNLECKNSHALSSSVSIEFLEGHQGKITLKENSVSTSKYFEVLAETREEVILKTDEGSLLILSSTVKGILLKNIDESFLVNYEVALCSK